MRRLRELVTIALTALALLALSAVMAQTVRAQDGEARLRVIHASPDAPAVDVYVGGQVLVEGAELGAVTDFYTMATGSADVTIVPAGGDPVEAVAEVTIDLADGVTYELAVTNFLDSLETVLYTVDDSEVTEGNARVRVIHLSPDTPPIDVAVTGGDVLFEADEFTNATEYIEVPAGTYDLEVRPFGSEDVAVALPGTELEAGAVYEFLGIGSLEDGSLHVIAVTLDGVVGGVGGETTTDEDATTDEEAADADEGIDADRPDDESDVHTLPDSGIGVTASNADLPWILVALATILAMAAVVFQLTPSRRD